MPGLKRAIFLRAEVSVDAALAKGLHEAQARYRLVVASERLGRRLRDYGIETTIAPESPGIVAAQLELDLRHSFVIGEVTTDTGGAFGLHLLSGEGMLYLDALPPEQLVFHSATEATRWLLAYPEAEGYLHGAIAEGARLLAKGGVVAFPTETVYGLGADALDSVAVGRLFAVKHRPLHDPLIVHIADREQLASLISRLPHQAEALMEAFWPGPLTLVLPKSSAVPDIVTSGQATVAIRMTANPWAQELIRQAGTPVAAPSANLFGRTSPTTAQHVHEQLGEACDLIIDAGACRVGVESTVVSLIGEQPLLLRRGGISHEQLEAVIGAVQVRGATSAALQSPGMLPSHYAPVTPLSLVEDLGPWRDDPACGIIVLAPSQLCFAGPVEILSEKGEIREAAVRLYAAIRHLDAMGLQRIVVQRVPEADIGSAINDRLEKAAWKAEG